MSLMKEAWYQLTVEPKPTSMKFRGWRICISSPLSPGSGLLSVHVLCTGGLHERAEAPGERSLRAGGEGVQEPEWEHTRSLSQGSELGPLSPT